jgi:hypothetical protein
MQGTMRIVLTISFRQRMLLNMLDLAITQITLPNQ